MRKLKVRHPPNTKVLSGFLFFGVPFLILGLLTGKAEFFQFGVFFAMFLVFPAAIIVLLMQRTFIFDDQTKQILIYRTIGWKKVILDGSRKEYSLSLKRIYHRGGLGWRRYPGTLLVLVLQEKGKTVYKIADGLSKRRLMFLAERIQRTMGFLFHDESNHTIYVSNMEERR